MFTKLGPEQPALLTVCIPSISLPKHGKKRAHVFIVERDPSGKVGEHVIAAKNVDLLGLHIFRLQDGSLLFLDALRSHRSAPLSGLKHKQYIARRNVPMTSLNLWLIACMFFYEIVMTQNFESKNSSPSEH